MFGIADLIALIISAFIILPVVVFIREFGYLPVTLLFGVKNPRITVGSGPRIFKIGIFDIRKYYHLYSWFSFDSIKRKSNFSYIMVYSAPILANVAVALTLNTLLANGFLEGQSRFWDRFIFYAFFYVLFDVIPMIMTNGKPNNGMIIYELLRYGKRVDYNEEDIIPSTTQVDKEYSEEMVSIRDKKIKKDMERWGSPTKQKTEPDAVGEEMRDEFHDTAQENEAAAAEKEKEKEHKNSEKEKGQ